MNKLKNVIALFLCAVLSVYVVLSAVSCGEKNLPSGEGNAAEKERETERVKRIVEKELSYLSPMYDDIEPLKYDSCTFTSVKENADGGHTLRGEVFFTDKHGVRYSQPYRAEIDKGSWAPRIVKFDIVKLN